MTNDENFIIIAIVVGNVCGIDCKQILWKCMNPTTIKDIAKKLNVSTSTVSRALRDHPDINAETKELIVKTAQELDYQPNTFAQNLKRQRSNTIGVIVPQVKHVFFAEIMSGITDVAYNAGYNVIISQSNENQEREIINTNAMIAQRVAGLLVSLSSTTRQFDHLLALERQGIPLVCFDRVCEELPVSKVIVDDYNGAFQAVKHLVDKGYKKIAHLAGPTSLSIGLQRFLGYKDALQKSSIPFQDALVVFGGLNEEDGHQSFETLVTQLGEFPDAIFAVTDPVALGAFMKIKERGLSIPQDIALVGFSDNPVVSLIEPPLTTVQQPAYKIGETATRLLLQQIEKSDRKLKNKTIVLPTNLIIRNST